MKTTILFSGFDVEAGFPQAVAHMLQSVITERQSIVYIASVPDIHEKTDRYRAQLDKWYNLSNIYFKESFSVDSRVTPEQAMTLVRHASCLFLMGGDTLAQMAFIRSYGLVDEIASAGAVVMGLSAGAINLGRISLCSRDEDTPETLVYDGVGRVDCTVDPHFDSADKCRLAELLPYSHSFPIHAMCDGSAILCEDDAVTCLGEQYLVKNEVMTQIT